MYMELKGKKKYKGKNSSQNATYDFSDHMKQLRVDIRDFGGNVRVEVVTEERNGKKIYKNYSLLDIDGGINYPLISGENKEIMTANMLLGIYERKVKDSYYI